MCLRMAPEPQRPREEQMNTNIFQISMALFSVYRFVYIYIYYIYFCNNFYSAAWLSSFVQTTDTKTGAFHTIRSYKREENKLSVCVCERHTLLQTSVNTRRASTQTEEEEEEDGRDDSVA